MGKKHSLSLAKLSVAIAPSVGERLRVLSGRPFGLSWQSLRSFSSFVIVAFGNFGV